MRPNMVIDTNQATIRLLDDVEITEKDMLRLIKVSLNQNQWDAVCSFFFNLGGTQLETSTFLKRLNAKRFSEAADEMLRWKFDNGKEIKGLLRRRMAERELFLRSQPIV